MSRSTVPPVLTGFAQRVVLRPGYDPASTQSFAVWDNTPSVKRLLRNARLDRIYSFGVRKTCYKVELITMWYKQQSPCWGLALRHVEWATHLAELEHLQTGHKASWGDTIATFLPEDGGSSVKLDDDDDLGMQEINIAGQTHELPRRASREGIRVLSKILLQLSKLVSSVTTAQGSEQV